MSDYDPLTTGEAANIETGHRLVARPTGGYILYAEGRHTNFTLERETIRAMAELAGFEVTER